MVPEVEMRFVTVPVVAVKRFKVKELPWPVVKKLFVDEAVVAKLLVEVVRVTVALVPMRFVIETVVNVAFVPIKFVAKRLVEVEFVVVPLVAIKLPTVAVDVTVIVPAVTEKSVDALAINLLA